MRWVTERDEFKKKNGNLKREIANLEFSNDKCNDKIFQKDEIIRKLREISNNGDEQVEILAKNNKKLQRKLKRRSWLVYGASGAGIAGIIFALLSK